MPRREEWCGREFMVCERCKCRRPVRELNIEAMIHHGAARPECYDRKACERRRRKRGV